MKYNILDYSSVDIDDAFFDSRNDCPAKLSRGIHAIRTLYYQRKKKDLFFPHILIVQDEQLITGSYHCFKHSLTNGCMLRGVQISLPVKIGLKKYVNIVLKSS